MYNIKSVVIMCRGVVGVCVVTTARIEREVEKHQGDQRNPSPPLVLKLRRRRIKTPCWASGGSLSLGVTRRSKHNAPVREGGEARPRRPFPCCPRFLSSFTKIRSIFLRHTRLLLIDRYTNILIELYTNTLCFDILIYLVALFSPF